MKKDLDNNGFDDLELFFRKNLEDNEVVPPKNIWRNIEFELEKDKKRRPFFFWWFGLGCFLILGLAGGYVIYEKFHALENHKLNPLAGKEIPSNTKIEQEEPKNNLSAQKKVSGKTENVVPQHSIPEKTPEVTRRNVKTNNHKTGPLPAAKAEANNANKADLVKIASQSNVIQIGAFKNKPSETYFEKIPYKVISKVANDGLNRYYVVVEGDIAKTKEDLIKCGIKSTYIPENAVDISTAYVVKSKEDNSLVTAFNEKAPAEQKTNNNLDHKKLNTQLTARPDLKNGFQRNPDKGSAEALAALHSGNDNRTNASPHGKEKSVIPGNKKTGNGVPEKTLSVNDPSKVLAEQEQQARPENLRTKEVSVIKPDSLGKVAALKDSTFADILKTDSANKSTQVLNEIKKDFIPQMAIIAEGGPNFSVSKAQSSSTDVSNEKYPLTYFANLKLQITPFKRFSFSIGAGYSNYSVTKDEVNFTFDKNITDDYIFYTSVGNVNVSKDIMYHGLYLNAPVQHFNGAYKYNAYIQAVNIPVEMQLNILNNNNFKLWVSGGLNANYFVTQNTSLTVRKEHIEDNITYNNVRANRINYIFLFGLGCDIRIKNKLYLTISPLYKRSLSRLSGSGDVNYKPAYISGAIGLKYIFKK